MAKIHTSFRIEKSLYKRAKDKASLKGLYLSGYICDLVVKDLQGNENN